MLTYTMKKFLGIFLCLIFFSLPISTVLAQTEEDLQAPTEISQEESTEGIEETEDVTEEEVIQPQRSEYSFLTILAAILIPSLFVIIGYIVLKFFKV